MEPAELARLVAALPEPPALGPDGMPFGNRADPLEELVFILLTLMTRSQASIHATFERLLELTDGALDRLDEVEEEVLLSALRPVGLASRRSEQLRTIAGAVRPAERWRAGLEAAGTEDVLAQLLALPGVGSKTAKCVAMYSLGRPVLPVDIHVLRVAKRIGLLEGATTWRSADAELERRVPDELKFDVHVRFVAHGRATCTSIRPSCDTCPVALQCPSAGTTGEPRRSYTR